MANTLVDPYLAHTVCTDPGRMAAWIADAPADLAEPMSSRRVTLRTR